MLEADPTHPPGNNSDLSSDITNLCSLLGPGGIRGGAAGAGAREGARAGTDSGGEQGVDTGEAREVRREEAAGDRRVGVLSEEDHEVEVGAGEELGVMRRLISLVGAKILNRRKSSNQVTTGVQDQTMNQ